MNKKLFIVMFSIFAFLSTQVFATSFKLTSPAIHSIRELGYFSKLKSAGRIESKYCAAPVASPNRLSFPIYWTGLPKGTKALAIVLDDPDAKPVMKAYGIKGNAFIHWLAADINPNLPGLNENASAEKPTFKQGKNTGGFIGYIGPQPPSDFPKNIKKPLIHIYRLTVYALSDTTGLEDGFSLEDLQTAMKSKVLGKSEFNISYSN